MAKQTINIGTTANDGTGDAIRAAFGKVNDNFTEIYTANTGVNTGDQNLSAYATTAAVEAGYQPLDSDLTAISALTTTAYGRALLSTADAATLRSAIGVGTTDAPTFLGVSTTTGGVLTSGSIEAGNGAVLGGTNSITVRTTNGTAALFRAFQASRENWTFGISAGTSSFDFLAAGNLRAQLTNTGNFSATSSLSAPVLTLTGQSLTGTQATSLVDLATTWLSTTGTPTAIKLNVTDTLSNANSLLMDLQVGGLSKFKVDKTGVVTPINVYSGGAVGYALFNDGGLGLRSAAVIGWTAGNALNAQDTILARDAAGIIAQRNGTAKQTLRIYNTYTSASIYERAVMDWNGPTPGNLQIGTEFLGSGSGMAARPIDFVTGGVARWQISAAGHLMSAGVTDGLYDIGASYANRPKDIYAAGMISSAGYIRSSAGFRFLAGGSYFVESANGVLNLTDSTLAGFNRLQLGGTADTHPAIARDGAGIKFTGAAAGSTSWIKVPAVAVASLPAAATAGVGARAFVNNALTPVFGSAVTGGGAVTVPVYSTGSAWNVG